MRSYCVLVVFACLVAVAIMTETVSSQKAVEQKTGKHFFMPQYHRKGMYYPVRYFHSPKKGYSRKGYQMAIVMPAFIHTGKQNGSGQDNGNSGMRGRAGQPSYGEEMNGEMGGTGDEFNDAYDNAERRRRRRRRRF